MSLYRNGIEDKGEWFAVLRPNGRLSGRMFRCPYRAAEHAMRGYGVAWWTELVRRGLRIVAVGKNER
jgi:hypothetical protein